MPGNQPRFDEAFALPSFSSFGFGAHPAPWEYAQLQPQLSPPPPPHMYSAQQSTLLPVAVASSASLRTLPYYTSYVSAPTATLLDERDRAAACDLALLMGARPCRVDAAPAAAVAAPAPAGVAVSSVSSSMVSARSRHCAALALRKTSGTAGGAACTQHAASAGRRTCKAGQSEFCRRIRTLRHPRLPLHVSWNNVCCKKALKSKVHRTISPQLVVSNDSEQCCRVRVQLRVARRAMNAAARKEPFVCVHYLDETGTERWVETALAGGEFVLEAQLAPASLMNVFHSVCGYVESLVDAGEDARFRIDSRFYDPSNRIYAAATDRQVVRLNGELQQPAERLEGRGAAAHAPSDAQPPAASDQLVDAC